MTYSPLTTIIRHARDHGAVDAATLPAEPSTSPENVDVDIARILAAFVAQARDSLKSKSPEQIAAMRPLTMTNDAATDLDIRRQDVLVDMLQGYAERGDDELLVGAASWFYPAADGLPVRVIDSVSAQASLIADYMCRGLMAQVPERLEALVDVALDVDVDAVSVLTRLAA